MMLSFVHKIDCKNHTSSMSLLRRKRQHWILLWGSCSSRFGYLLLLSTVVHTFYWEMFRFRAISLMLVPESASNARKLSYSHTCGGTRFAIPYNYGTRAHTSSVTCELLAVSVTPKCFQREKKTSRIVSRSQLSFAT